MRNLALLLALALATAGCGGSDDTNDTTGMTTTAATTTTATTTTTTVGTTTTTESGLPTYSEVVATYPAGAELCSGWGGISGSDGAYTLEELDGRGAMAGIQDGQIQVTCLGAQYTVTGPMVDEDGNEWPVGTLLTVDSELNFVEVSGFDATDGSSSDTDAFANCPELADWLRQSALASEAAFSGGESVQEAATFFYDFADNAPAEIRDDMLTWADAYQQFADNLDAIGVDFSDPEQMASMTTDQIAALEAAVSGFALPEVESAIDRIDTFIEDSCS